jgi:hypothetical protein
MAFTFTSALPSIRRSFSQRSAHAAVRQFGLTDDALIAWLAVMHLAGELAHRHVMLNA